MLKNVSNWRHEMKTISQNLKTVKIVKFKTIETEGFLYYKLNEQKLIQTEFDF